MTQTTADLIRKKSEMFAKAAFVPSANATDEATIATAEGLLAGVAEMLVQRVGPERAFTVIARQADILDRVVLDGRRPTKPKNYCGEVD